MSRPVTRLFALCALSAVAFGASGTTVTGTLLISATVVDSCSIATQPLSFADYRSDGAAASATAHAGIISLTCTKGTPVMVYLDSVPQLHSPSGTTLAYTLASPTGRAWNSTSGVGAVGQGRTPVTLKVVGSIPAGQRAGSGTYRGEQLVRVVY
ncbi:spore coat U domain-containing protein [Bacillus sp. NP157]|nr:spore coat U domain-containing protein [Bacillus sp. NP157]